MQRYSRFYRKILNIVCSLSMLLLALSPTGGWQTLSWVYAEAPASQLTSAAQTAAAPLYPSGTSLVPLDSTQTQLRQAYSALFTQVYASSVTAGQQVALSAAPSAYNSTAYAPGTALGLGGLSGNFDSVSTNGTYTVTRAHTLKPVRIALFYSQVRDASNQVVTWEEATFETIFRVYLWGGDYFRTVSEANILSGTLANYDVLILPSITIGYAGQVSAALGAAGQAAIAKWVAQGGTLYAQGDGAYLAETAGLAPVGTVDLNHRLTDNAPYDNLAHLQVTDPLNLLTFSWQGQQTYILDDPVLAASSVLTAVATYTDTTRPNTPAILYGRVGQGQVILTNAHPSARQSTYPLVFDALFAAMSERAGLTGRVKQLFSPTVADDVVPAYEAGIPISVTTDVRDYWDAALADVTLTETVSLSFTVDISDVTPAPASFTTGPGGTLLVWNLATLPPGVSSLNYVARTLTDTVASGSAQIGVTTGTYTDPYSGLVRHFSRAPLGVHAQMAARLNGDRDIELDAIYPIPAEGTYFDIALTLENKEETLAKDVVITDVVPLISPLVDVDDQRHIPTVLTDTATMTSTPETIWVANEVFFYNNANYPLPHSAHAVTDVINLSNWDGVTYYTYTSTLTNSVTIPVTYTSFIHVDPDGSLRLPAAVLTYTFGDMPAYDYLDPAVRYGIFSQELLKRQVSFASDPMTNTGVIMNASGGSVFTNLGGDPIPYHQYLSSGVIVVPQSPYTTQAAYHDIWGRPHAMDLRTTFYDVVPFPPPEYHAVVNTTFDMHADWNRDGQFTDPVLEYPSRVPVNLHLMLKSHSNFDPTLPPLRKDETLLSQGLFKGLGFTLAPNGASWRDAWSFRDLQHLGPTATVLTDVIDTPAYTYLYFQQELQSQAYETIDITGTLSATGQHTEGIMKINDGARFVYHQKAAGPSRYEVFDSHVQAVFGLRSDAEVSKKVGPVRVATYGDTVYHFIQIQDPWEPRQFTTDPFIQSYGFGDMAATVYVGGRHQRDLLHASLAPGEATQIRLEINNNTGLTLTNVSLVPTAPAGITVTLRSYTATTAIEPLFYDFPFLNATTLPDAWKGVYYFDVQTANPFPGALGQVYTVGFTLQGDNIPTYFRIPAAQIGVQDASGNVSTIYGQATNLTLQDQLPTWATLRDARIANPSEMTAMVNALNYDDAHLGSDTAGTLYATLRGGVTTSTITSTTGSQVSFTLPPEAQTMPWRDAGATAQTLYVILKSDLGITWSGTALADDAPVITYRDSFGQLQTSVGNSQTVEAHGAALVVTYTVDGVSGNWVPGDPLIAGQQSEVTVLGTLVNAGDDIAANTTLTFTLPTSTTAVNADPAWASTSATTVVWKLGDLGPGAGRVLHLTLSLTPPPAQFGTRQPLINSSSGRFLNVYAQKLVTANLAGALDISVGGSAVVYTNTFAGAAGPEWSKGTVSTTPSGRRFLGEFSSETVRLSLANLPAHGQAQVDFDLFLIRSWDGNTVNMPASPRGLFGQPGLQLSAAPGDTVGPDLWQLQADGRMLLHTTFANWQDPRFRQAYPGTYPGGDYAARTGAAENNTLGYGYKTFSNMDSVYHLSYRMPHTAATLALDFAALGLQDITDESWGLDNVQVTVITGNASVMSGRMFLPMVGR